jgi:hypothetical protein
MGVHAAIDLSRENAHEKSINSAQRTHVHSRFSAHVDKMHDFTIAFAELFARLNARVLATEIMVGTESVTVSNGGKALCGAMDMLLLQEDADGICYYVIAELKTSMDGHRNNMADHFLRLAHVEQLHCYAMLFLTMCKERGITMPERRIRLLLIGQCVNFIEAWQIDYRPDRFMCELDLEVRASSS